jgi:hypothetical protein
MFWLPFLQWRLNEDYIFRVCVHVALGMQHAMRMRHIGACGLPGCTVYLHVISHNGTIFEKKERY